MKREFWHDRWQANETGFHQSEYNPSLVRHWPALKCPAGTSVFVPLCGKSLDMRWLAASGYKVTGIELSPIAAQEFFSAAREPCSVVEEDAMRRYRYGDIEILCGDFFALHEEAVSHIGAVYDRGALIALPQEMRRSYVDHLLGIAPHGISMLLICLEYDQSLVAGPPFSVNEAELNLLYGVRCKVTCLEQTSSDDMPPKFRENGVTEVTTKVYKIVKNE